MLTRCPRPAIVCDELQYFIREAFRSKAHPGAVCLVMEAVISVCDSDETASI